MKLYNHRATKHRHKRIKNNRLSASDVLPVPPVPDVIPAERLPSPLIPKPLPTPQDLSQRKLSGNKYLFAVADVEDGKIRIDENTIEEKVLQGGWYPSQVNSEGKDFELYDIGTGDNLVKRVGSRPTPASGLVVSLSEFYSHIADPYKQVIIVQKVSPRSIGKPRVPDLLPRPKPPASLSKSKLEGDDLEPRVSLGDDFEPKIDFDIRKPKRKPSRSTLYNIHLDQENALYCDWPALKARLPRKANTDVIAERKRDDRDPGRLVSFKPNDDPGPDNEGVMEGIPVKTDKRKKEEPLTVAEGED